MVEQITIAQHRVPIFCYAIEQFGGYATKKQVKEYLGLSRYKFQTTLSAAIEYGEVFELEDGTLRVSDVRIAELQRQRERDEFLANVPDNIFPADWFDE